MSARDRVLYRVRRALTGRPEAALPAVIAPEERDPEEAFALFRTRLEAAGARVARLDSLEEARGFLAEAESGLQSAWAGAGVPEALRPRLPLAEPERAGLGVSLALAGVAETGSVVLTAREGRRGQLLVPRHLVWLFAGDLFGSLLEALRRLRGGGVSALALHSGPSKSADIGQIMVKGVHGPGELWVGVLTFDSVGLEASDRSVNLEERLKGLTGRVLTTKENQTLTVVGLSKPGNTLYLALANGKKEGLPVKYVKKAVELIEAGISPQGPKELGEAVAKALGLKGPPKAGYLWAILHALGYV